MYDGMGVYDTGGRLCSIDVLNMVNIEFHSESMEILQHINSKGLFPNTRQSIELVKIQ